MCLDARAHVSTAGADNLEGDEAVPPSGRPAAEFDHTAACVREYIRSKIRGWAKLC